MWILILVSPHSLNAQSPYYFESITHQNGLSSDIITDIYQDREGYLWFSTEDGLNRYDGYSFKIFRKDFQNHNSITDNNVKAIAEDRSGRLWIGTRNNGISVFDKNAGTFTTISTDEGPVRLPTNNIESLHIDNSNNIWIGTENYGILRITPEKELVVYRAKNRNLSNLTSIKTIYEDSNNKLWIGTWGSGLYHYDPENDNFFPVALSWPEGFSRRPVVAIHEDKFGRFWIGTWENGLFVISGSAEEGFEIINHTYIYDDANPHNIHSMPSGDIVFSIDEDRDGNIWIGSNNGVAVFDLDDIHNPVFINADKNHSFAPNNSQIFKVFSDREGLIWLGTKGGGIHKVNMERLRYFTHEVPYFENSIFEETAVFSLFEKDQDNVYLGVKSEGFLIYNRKARSFTSYRDHGFYGSAAKINTAYAFEKDSSGRLWVGTRYLGALIFDYEKEKIISLRQQFPEMVARGVNVIFRDLDNYMWLGTENGLYILRKFDQPLDKEYELIHFDHSNPNTGSVAFGHITSIVQDSRGHIWVGTLNDGLNRFTGTFPTRDAIFEHFSFSADMHNALPSNRINDVYEDNSGNIWIATEGSAGSLALFNTHENNFVSFNKSDGLIGDHVFSILQDTEGYLWLTTNKGIVRFHKNDEKEPEMIYFTTADGLQGNIFIRNSKKVASDGSFFFGGYNGFNIFDPQGVKLDKTPPRVAITRLMFGDEVVAHNPAINEPYIVSYQDKVFTVDFTLLSYKDPGNNRFAWKLEGFDEDWVYRDASVRQAVYTNLRRGKYSFLVKAANSNGVWSGEPERIDFIVKPALMASYPALAIYALILIFIVYGTGRMIIYRSRMRQQLLLEKLEQRKLEQIHQLKLRSFANVSHELLTPLSVINCVVDNYTGEDDSSVQSMKLMKKNVNKLKKLIDQLLLMRKIDTGHMKLAVKKGDIKPLLQDIFNAFEPLASGKGLEFKLEFEKEEFYGYFDAEKLEMIIQNLLSNALKFTASGQVVVKCNTVFNDGKKWFAVSVSDTGSGIAAQDLEKVFERFSRVNENQAIPGMGIGLDLVRSLTHIHMGSVNVNSKEGVGTTFIIEIPLEKDFYDGSEIKYQPLLNKQTDPVAPAIQPAMEKIHEVEYDNSGKDKVVKDEGKRTLLLVEDNEDLRQVIGGFLSQYFEVEEAEDGAVALEIARYLSPDVIVSDVMMPNMSGFELCNRIKSDIETSHIPVVLLTARVDDSSKAEAYSYGADSYLTKPVNTELLLTRINSILDARDGLKDYYRRRCIFAPEENNVKIPPLDETYIKRATELIEKNLENPEFSVQMLTTEMGTSNSMLYRKFNKILGVTPNELIKNMRIKFAAEMLSKGTYTVSEVAYSIGFNDLSYFGKCFKKAYGLSPSDFKESKSAEFTSN